MFCLFLFFNLKYVGIAERETLRQIDGDRERDRERQTDRQTDREKHTQRDRDRERDRETV